MAVVRVNKTEDYTVMSNKHLKEKDMSLKAKGLLSLMLSLPDDWDYSISGLSAICKENENAIKNTLDELKAFGYLIVTKKMPGETKTGRIEYIYDIYEQPQQKQGVEKQGVEIQGVEKQGLEIQGLENQGQLNTNIVNTNISNTNKGNTKKASKNNFDSIILAYTDDEETIDLLREWLKVRKAKRAAMTDRAVQMNIEKLDSLAGSSGMTVPEYLKEIICRGWAAFYEIQNYKQNGPKNTPNRNAGGNVFLDILDGLED